MTVHRRELTAGQVFRYPRPTQPDVEFVDGLPSFHWYTATKGLPQVQLESGINQPAAPTDVSPVVLVRVTGWKAHTASTPWRDQFDHSSGIVTYHGDNKIDPATKRPKADKPGEVVGNRTLENTFWRHQSSEPSERDAGGPVLVFTGVAVGSRQKGNVRFDGLAIVNGLQYERQVDPTTGHSFANYVFSLQLLDLGPDRERIDWRWISARRRAEPSEEFAPVAWQSFVRDGFSQEQIAWQNSSVTPLSP
jgi:hypothetical protein